MPGAPALLVLLPMLAAGLLAMLPRRDWGAWINLGVTALGLLLACRLPFVVSEPGDWFVTGPIPAHMALLNGGIGLATAWTSHRAALPDRPRLHHALFQAVLASANLAVLADHAMLTWVALEAGVLALILAAPPTGPAAGRVLVLAGAALTFAAFGTLLLYLAALPALGPGWDALRWSALVPAAARCDGAVLSLAFVLLLIGYGGLAGLVPLQGWLIEAQAAPPLLAGALGGLLPGAALTVILRLRGVLDDNAQAVAPGGPIMALGLATLLLAAFGLWRAQEQRRWLALSSVGQNGLVALAFGLGGAAATLAGLLHLTAHLLTRAAAFQALAVPPSRSSRLALMLAVAVIAGLPPFAPFGSLMLILQQAMQHGLAVALLAGLGIGVGSWAMLMRPAAPPAPSAPDRGGSAGAFACLVAALALGLGWPVAGTWFQAMAAVAQ